MQNADWCFVHPRDGLEQTITANGDDRTPRSVRSPDCTSIGNNIKLVVFITLFTFGYPIQIVVSVIWTQ